MTERREPTAAQIDYAKRLMVDLGYMHDDVQEIFGKDFDDLTRSEMARLIDDMRSELGYE